MKIVHINTEEFKGGAAIACNRISKALNNSGVISQTFTIKSLSTFDNKKVWLNLMLEKLLFSFYQESKKVRFKFVLPFFGTNITKYPEIKNADIIHLHWVQNGFLSLKSLKQLAALNKPIVWTLHDMGAFTGGCFYSADCENYKTSCGNCFYLKKASSNDISASIFQLKKDIYPTLALHLITCSNWLRVKAAESSLFNQLTIQTIPNPIDTDVFKPAESNEIRNKLGIQKNSFLILFVAANITDERKGMIYLNEAISKLCETNSEVKNNIELLIIGDTKKLSSTFACKHTFTGYISGEASMSSYYDAADMFVAPSLEDNLPNTVMESLSCGTPVLAFNTGGIPDMIDHKENGYLANFKSDEDLADGIMWLYNNRDHTKIKEAARNKVLATFTPQIVASKYTQLYNQTISRYAKN